MDDLMVNAGAGLCLRENYWVVRQMDYNNHQEMGSICLFAFLSLLPVEKLLFIPVYKKELVFASFFSESLDFFFSENMPLFNFLCTIWLWFWLGFPLGLCSHFPLWTLFRPLPTNNLIYINFFGVFHADSESCRGHPS